MDIRTVFNAPEKQWIDLVNLTIQSAQAATQGKYGLEQQLSVIDVTGAQSNLKLQTKYPEGCVQPNEQGITMPFRCKWVNSRSGRMLIGYPQKTAPNPQSTQNYNQAPPSLPVQDYVQATQRGYAQTAPTKDYAKPVDWDAKDERIVRQNTLNRATELFIAACGGEAPPWPLPDGICTQICQLAEKLKTYVYAGTGGMTNPDFSDNPPPPQDEEIPF